MVRYDPFGNPYPKRRKLGIFMGPKLFKNNRWFYRRLNKRWELAMNKALRKP